MSAAIQILGSTISHDCGNEYFNRGNSNNLTPHRYIYLDPKILGNSVHKTVSLKANYTKYLL